MAHVVWIDYDTEKPETIDTVKSKFPDLSFEFMGDDMGDDPKTNLETIMLPVKGSVFRINGFQFILRFRKSVECYESYYHVGAEAYGGTWIRSSEAVYMDEDDRFFLGRPRLVPSGSELVTYYYHIQKRGKESHIFKMSESEANALIQSSLK